MKTSLNGNYYVNLRKAGEKWEDAEFCPFWIDAEGCVQQDGMYGLHADIIDYVGAELSEDDTDEQIHKIYSSYLGKITSSIMNGNVGGNVSGEVGAREWRIVSEVKRDGCFRPTEVVPVCLYATLTD